ncbi:hypothetical protein GQ457_16G016660 [Hibiscus cannabinus]
MGSREDAERVIGRFDGLWLYGSRLRVSFAKGGSRETFWRTKRQELRDKPIRSDDLKSTKNQNQEGRLNSASNIMNTQRRQIEGVIDNDKMEILNVCVICLCRRPYKDDTMRQNVLASGKLDECGLPIQVWSEKTFGNIASLWGELVQIDVETLLPSSFERARFQIETDWRFHIDEDIEVRVGELCFTIRVTEIEEAIGPKCNCSCELVEESELYGKQDGKENEKVRIAVSAVKGGDGENYSEENVVPNLISLTGMDTLEVDKIWEDNKVVDWRVMETASWMMDENVGMMQRDEEVRDNDVSAECGLRDELPVQTTKDADVISPICNGPSNRVNITKVIEYRGQQRKVRRISYVLLSEIPSPEQAVAPNQNLKKGRGRPKSKNTEDKRIVNGSLSNSDFVNRKRIMLREAEEVLQLGKLIGAETNGNEKAIGLVRQRNIDRCSDWYGNNDVR